MIIAGPVNILLYTAWNNGLYRFFFSLNVSNNITLMVIVIINYWLVVNLTMHVAVYVIIVLAVDIVYR